MTKQQQLLHELHQCIQQYQQRPQDVSNLKKMGGLYFRLGKLQEARQAFEFALQFQPFDTDLHYKMGMSYLKTEDPQAIEHFSKVLQYHPKKDVQPRLIAKLKLAKAYKFDEQYDQARKFTEQVLKKEPENASALSLLGQLEQQAGKNERAHELFQKVVELKPDNPAAHLNLGSTALLLQRTSEAIQHYEQAIGMQPNWATPYRELSRCYQSEGDSDKALTLLKKAIQLAPQEVENYRYLDAFYRSQGNYKAAIQVAKKITKLKPDDAEAWFNIGSSMTQLGITKDCLPYFEKAFELLPTAQAAYAIGNVYKIDKKTDLANQWFAKTLELDDTYFGAQYQLIANRAAHCDWSQRAADEQLLLDTLQQHVESERHDIPVPTLYFNYFDIPMAWHKKFNQHYAKTSKQQGERLKKQRSFEHTPGPRKRLKIGYISPDFRNHPVGRLVAELFQQHDRSKVEVYGYSLSTAQQDDPIRSKIEAGFDVFRELCFHPTVGAAEQIYEDGIDILVDLGGHTAHTRPDILAMQPAPIQAHMIGYPNTMGASYMQYMLADPYLVPEQVFEFYTEKVVQLPSSFVGVRPKMPAVEVSRSEMGLPEEGFVFMAFNRPSKIEPELFRVWMNILRAVPASVLWLSDFEEQTRRNLRQFAQQAGITPDRLIFAQWQPYGKYLKSHELADLFLDTWHYSAGSTAIAALGAGLPVLTCMADNNAARMGASIVAASGLTDLICRTLAEYEEKAIALAKNDIYLQQLRQQLVPKQQELLLFDNKRFAKHLEQAFQELWHRYEAGESPDHIFIT